MHSTDFNRTAFVVLASILFPMLLVAFSNLVFAPVRPAVPGFALPSSASAPAAASAAATAPKETPVPVLLAKADAKKGEQIAKVCATCHNFEKGGGIKVGPPLWGVVGRPVASFPGFDYSDSIKKIGGDWTYEKLFHWIADPKAMASDTKMAFPGEKEPEKDADVLAYLQTLSDKPVPFPQPTAAEAAPAAAAPAAAAAAPAAAATPAAATRARACGRVAAGFARPCGRRQGQAGRKNLRGLSQYREGPGGQDRA